MSSLSWSGSWIRVLATCFERWIIATFCTVCLIVVFCYVRGLIEDSGALCPSICDALSGHLHDLHISLQHCYEADIFGNLVLHCVVHEVP